MLTLRKFELQISPTIVYRGREYYENGTVSDLEEIGKDIWQAEVMGTEPYEVEVEMFRHEKIRSYSCDCPYEDGICKHVVAVLFLLREKTTNTVIRGKIAPQTGLSKLIQKITLEEYQEFILAYATKDKTFRSLLERHFADKDSGIDLGDKYAKQIKRLIRSHSNGNYIDYRSIYKLAIEVNELLDEGRQLIEKENFSGAFIVARSVLTEVIELITYCDDSDGYIGDIINNSIALITVIADESPIVELQEKILYFLQSTLNLPIYFDYGRFGYEMVDLYQTLAIKLNREKAYLEFVDGQIKIASADKRSYKTEYFILAKLTFLKATGNVEAATKLFRENSDIFNIRYQEVNTLIEENDFYAAKELIAEGIKIAEKKKEPGTVVSWQKELLRIAVVENDRETIRYYTKYFAFDRGFDKVYYDQWKTTFAIDEWKAGIEKYIEEAKSNAELRFQESKGKAWCSIDTLLLDLLAPIYIEEKYWDRLIILVSKEPDLDRLFVYNKYLVKKYPEQLLATYIPAFERYGDIVGHRKGYSDLAIRMKTVINAIPEGKDKIIAVAKKLVQKYPRRPAMIEELNAVITR